MDDIRNSRDENEEAIDYEQMDFSDIFADSPFVDFEFENRDMFEDIFCDSPMPEELSLERNDTNFDDLFADSPIVCDEFAADADDVRVDFAPNNTGADEAQTPDADAAVPMDSVVVTNEVGTAPVIHGNEEYPSFIDIEDVSDISIQAQPLFANSYQYNNRRHRAHLTRAQVGGSTRINIPTLFLDLTPLSETVTTLSDFNHTIYKTVYSVRHNFQEYADIFAVEHEIDSIFSSLINEKTEEAQPHDIVTVTINHETLSNPIYVSARKNSFEPQNILNAIYEVCQSDRTMIINGEMEITVEITKRLQGRAKVKTPLTVAEWRRLRKCIVSLRNIDNSCGYYAIALAVFYTTNPNMVEKRNFRENRTNRLVELTTSFCREANLDINYPLSIEHYQQVDQFLRTKEIRFFVINGETKNYFYKSESAFKKEAIIEIYEEHYYIVTSLEAYTEQRHFCRECWVGYSNLNEHKCILNCDRCQKSVGCSGDEIHCAICNRNFFGNTCYRAHLESKLCSTKKCCSVCEVEYQSRKGHSCNKYNCTKCGDEFEESPHYCYIKRKDISKLLEEDSKTQIFVFFDIESRFESSVITTHGMTTRHTPMCLCARVVCNHCFSYELNDKRIGFCRFCFEGSFTFYGVECVKEFGNYLYNVLAKQADKADAKLLVVAHNFRGYDGHFVMQDLFDRKFTKLLPIMNGSKILKLTVGNVIFIDSLSFLNMPLAKLPKVFNFETRALKGYFPFKFNTAANENYVGPIPPLADFGCDRLLPDDLEKLTRWYETVRNNPYNLKEEVTKYCMNDTDILMIAVMNFKKQYVEITSINPLTRNFTLASMCLEVFRARILKDDKTLGVTPICGYSKRVSSMNENVWLDTEQRLYTNKIKRQYRIGKYFADGFVEDNGRKIAFEYWGCYFHGCPTCFSRSQILAYGETAQSLFEKVESKKAYYQRRNILVVEIWECRFKYVCEISNDQMLKERIEHYKLLKEVGGVNIRDAFIGGRTNNLRFYYNASDREEIKYKDVVSLYPTVLKKCYFPVGHPEILNGDFDYSLESYVEGFVKCKVLAPKELYLPLLGQKFHERLIFPLCKICANLRQTHDCEHSDDERGMIGTFTLPELRVALRLGYRIQRIYQIAHYTQRSNTIFVDYVNMFQKEKTEASGLPIGLETEEAIQSFIDEFERNEGIRLDRSKIRNNPGARGLSKDCLNGFWGKLSQKPNLPQTVICSDYTHFWNIISNDELDVLGHTFPNDKTVILNYKKKNVEECDEGNTSLAVAAYVTAHARLYLYDIMEKVIRNGYDRLLYFDTDSVIYIFKEGDTDLDTGCYFGQLTDEIVKYGRNSKGKKFVSCGPKNYGIEVDVDGVSKTTIKTKGIRYDAQNLELVSMETMTEMAKKYIAGNPEEQRLMQWRIKSNARNHIVETVEFEKVYRCVSEKRRVIGNGTVPYGFKGNLPYEC